MTTGRIQHDNRRDTRMKQLCWVANCGDYTRTIFAVTGIDQVHIGCFSGTFEDAERTNLNKYFDADYQDKLHELHKQWQDPEYRFDPEKFNWELYSWAVAEYCPEHFDPDKYNWEKDSYEVARYCPEHFDPDKFNWESCSCSVAKHCPEHFDPDKFNWAQFSWAVAEYCQEHFDPEKFNWKQFSGTVAKYCPEHFDPDKYNWKQFSGTVAKYCPEYLKYQPKETTEGILE